MTRPILALRLAARVISACTPDRPIRFTEVETIRAAGIEDPVATVGNPIFHN